MTTPDPHADWHTIRVAGPLPMGVAGALMQLIGSAWPESVIDTSGRGDRRRPRRVHYGQDALVMLVPPKAAKRVTKKAAKAIRAEAEEAEETGELFGFDGGWVKIAPPEELGLYLGSVAKAMLDAHEDAVNYVEWEVRDRESLERTVLSVARSKGQTPHALRMAAEAERDQVRALLIEAVSFLDSSAAPVDLETRIMRALGEDDEVGG